MTNDLSELNTRYIHTSKRKITEKGVDDKLKVDHPE